MRPASMAAGGAPALPPAWPNGNASTPSNGALAWLFSTRGEVCAPSVPPRKCTSTIVAIAISASADQSRVPRGGALLASCSSSARLEVGRIELLLHRAKCLGNRRIDGAQLKARHRYARRLIGDLHALDAAPVEIGRMPVRQL